jgi:acyl-coenzyme A thioesterase PaaI-like protein
MLDSCMGLAIQSTLEKGVGNRGRRVGTAEGRVTDTKGRLLVHGTTTCLVFLLDR